MDAITPNPLPPISPAPLGHAPAEPLPGSDRRMVQSTLGGKHNARVMARAELCGSHTHDAADGSEIHIWERDGRYLARGSYHGKPFGQTLGGNVHVAQIQLRTLLGEIDRGAFERASERSRQAVRTGVVPKFTPSELVNAFLTDVRRRKGKNTTDNYSGRLAPGIEFWEQSRKRWALASDLDRTFATELKASLYQRCVTPNGHPLAVPHRMSPGHIINVMTCWGTMMHWATRNDVRLLPAGFANPFSRDLIGERAQRDPLAPPVLPLELRVQLVGAMDIWQLATLALSLILPERPEDFAGLLISEVDRRRHELIFGTRCSGDDTTKAGVAFHAPYPAELDPIIDWLTAGRVDGPLLRARRIVVYGKSPRLVAATTADIQRHFEQYLARLAPGEVTCPQDRKRAFRRVLVKLGGVSPNAMGDEFHQILAQVRPDLRARFYDLKGSVTTSMKDAGVDHITRMYLTGHALSKEILASYESQRLQEHTAAYFRLIAPLLVAIRQRAAQMGIA